MISNISNISHRVVFRQQEKQEIKNSQGQNIILSENARHELGISNTPRHLLIGTMLLAPLLFTGYCCCKCYDAISTCSKYLSKSVKYLKNLKH